MKGPRLNKNGRSNKGGRFAALPHRVLTSVAYGSLDLTARALLTELVMLENGGNNGSLWLSVRDAAGRLGLVDHRAVTRAFEALQDRSFVQLTKDAHFSVKAADTSRARCWRISWIVWGEGARDRRAPCWSFEQYQIPSSGSPPDEKVRKRATMRSDAMQRWQKAMSENRLPVVKSTTTEANMTQNDTTPVVDFTTANPKTDAILPKPVVVDFTAHTDVTMPSDRRGWWDGPHVDRITATRLALVMIAAQNTKPAYVN